MKIVTLHNFCGENISAVEDIHFQSRHW